ncbi:MAG: type II secretion system protein GspD [Lentisphaerae bacterium]|nr:type II secretion system protein GspD [Lentisphaerota bacterium]
MSRFTAGTCLSLLFAFSLRSLAQDLLPPSAPVRLPNGLGSAPAVMPTPAASAPAAVPDPAADLPGGELKFNMASTEIVLNDYAQKTGRTLLMAPNLPKVSVTLRSQGALPMTDYLQAIDTVLTMNGIALLKVGDTFLKAVPIAQAGEEAMKISEVAGEDPLPEKGQLVSQMMVIRNIELETAKKAVDALKHGYAKVVPFESINSLLITDDAANINRIMQMLRIVDQPVEVREEPNIIHILHAKPADIKAKLEEIIAESQKDEAKKAVVAQPRMSGAPGVVPRPAGPAAPVGLIRPGLRSLVPTAPSPAEEQIVETVIEEAERGIIRGKVRIVSDDRTGILIIITRPENMSFFEKIIKVLDVATAPDVIVKVFRLEYAEAKAVAGMLNDLVGAAAKGEDASKPVRAEGAAEGEAAALRDYVKSLGAGGAEKAGKSKIGELYKDNIKILSDERTNSLIIMASRSDIATISEIVADMDMMLSQVLIEAAILDIQLSDTLSAGVDWLQRSMVSFNENGAGTRTPVLAFTGSGGGGSATPFNATAASSPVPFAGLSYYFTYFGLNLDAVLKMAQTDSRVKVVSTPVILTTDNKEAKITSTDLMYVYSGTTRRSSTEGGDYDNYEQKEVGLELTVKPHINENRVVMMDIEQRLSQPNAKATQGVATENLTGTIIYSSRTLSAAIAVENRQTIVLGGLVSERTSNTKGGIPVLSSIPFLGWLFGSHGKTASKTETVVFITPYVLDTPEDIAAESRRRKQALQAEGLWKQGWSESELADPARGSPAKKGQPPAPKPAAPVRSPDPGSARVPAGSDGRDAEAAIRVAEAELAVRERILKARTEVMTARQKNLDIARREQELAEKELQLRRRELELAERERALGGSEREVQVRSGLVAEQEAKLSDRRREVRLREMELDAADESPVVAVAAGQEQAGASAN